MVANVEENKKALSGSLDNTEQALGSLEGVLGLQEGEVDGLPEGWCSATLEDIATWGSGGTPSRANSQYYGGNIPWVKTGDLGPRIVMNASEFITEEAVANSSAKFFPKGSVALAMYGATIGKTSILGIDATTNQACGVGNPIQGATTTNYLYYLLRNEKDAFIAKGKGGAQPNISQTLIKAHEILLPSLAEQAIIAQTLDALLAQVDNIKTRLDTIPKILKNFCQSVLDAGIRGELTKEWRQVNEHEKWASLTLGDVASWGAGGTPSRKNIEYYCGDIPWIKTGDLGPKYVVKASEFITNEAVKNSSAKLFPKGSVAIAMYGATIGRTSILDIEATTNQACAVGNPIAGITTAIFLYYFLLSEKPAFIAKGKGGAQPNISQSVIKLHDLLLPPIEEQTEIVRRVEELFAFADQIEQQVKNAQGRVNNLTQSILAKAFRGELTTQWRAENPELISGENSAQALLAAIKKEREELKPVKKSSAKKAIKKTIKKKEAIAVKKPKAVVEAVSAIARQNKQEKPSKGLDNAATAILIEIPVTDVQWSAFIRSHYKKSNPYLALDDLISHLAQALQVKRLSPQRKALLIQVIKKSCKGLVLYKEAGEYCLYESQFADYDNEDLDILLPKLLRKGSSASQDDLYKSYLQALGFKRSSPKAEQRFKSYLRSALIRKILQREGDELKRV